VLAETGARRKQEFIDRIDVERRRRGGVIKIFIADSSQTSAKLHERLLKSAGYFQTSSCSVGSEALEKTITESFDVILIDMKMLVTSTGVHIHTY
jgi:PleD family two-component response regulator